MEKAEDIEKKGGFPAKWIRGNTRVDEDAKLAVWQHTVDFERLTMGDDRIAIAQLMQAMQVEVWAAITK